MPHRLCLEPTCANPADYRGRCKTHARQRDRQINRAGYRIYRTKRWRIARDRYLADHPLCDICGRIATDVHHRTDINQGGDPWNTENFQSLCKPHHSQETRRRQHEPAR